MEQTRRQLCDITEAQQEGKDARKYPPCCSNCYYLAIVIPEKPAKPWYGLEVYLCRLGEVIEAPEGEQPRGFVARHVCDEFTEPTVDDIENHRHYKRNEGKW